MAEQTNEKKILMQGSKIEIEHIILRDGQAKLLVRFLGINGRSSGFDTVALVDDVVIGDVKYDAIYSARTEVDDVGVATHSIRKNAYLDPVEMNDEQLKVWLKS